MMDARRFGLAATLREIAQAIDDGEIPVKGWRVYQYEPDAESIAEGSDPNELTLMISIDMPKPIVEIPAAFYREGN